MNVTGLRDWARLGGGGINAEGNALLYKVCASLAYKIPGVKLNLFIILFSRS